MGGLTLIMVPFTWVCMTATNNVLFGLQRESWNLNQNQTDGVAGGEVTATLEGVRELVVRWGWMHLVRSLFPLVAAVVGLGVCV